MPWQQQNSQRPTRRPASVVTNELIKSRSDCQIAAFYLHKSALKSTIGQPPAAQNLPTLSVVLRDAFLQLTSAMVAGAGFKLVPDRSVALLVSFCLQYYWLFVLSRGLVGIGESSYSSISPTIIGDLFTNNSRTTMLSIFYLAIPLGRWGFQIPSHFRFLLILLAQRN